MRKNNMKNTILKTIGTLLAVLVLTVFTQISVSAQDEIFNEKSDEQTQEEVSNRNANTRKLEGVWNYINTRRNCVTGEAIQTFAVMHTYMRGGTMIDFGVGGAPLPRNTGQGIWSYLSGR